MRVGGARELGIAAAAGVHVVFGFNVGSLATGIVTVFVVLVLVMVEEGRSMGELTQSCKISLLVGVSFQGECMKET